MPKRAGLFLLLAGALGALAGQPERVEETRVGESAGGAERGPRSAGETPASVATVRGPTLPTPAAPARSEIAKATRVDAHPVFESAVPEELPGDLDTVFGREVFRQRFVGAWSDIDEAEFVIWNLFDDTHLVAERRDVTRQDEIGSRYTWRGRIEGDPNSEVVALVHDGRLTASIALSDGAVFTVDTLPSGVLRVREQNPAALPGCGSDLHEQAMPLPEGAAPPGGTEPAPADAAAAESTPTIDLLLLYTQGAVDSFGAGVTGLEDRLALAIAWANVIYANTGASQRLSAAGMVQVAYDDSHGNGMTALDHVTDANDGVLDEAAALRNQYGGDLVMLVTRPSNVCGIAWVATDASNIGWYESYMFSVVNVLCTDSGKTLAHELGHNQGAYHDPETALQQGMTQAQIDAVTPPNAFGYIGPGDAFHTTLAYSGTCSGCTYVQHFATPLLSYQGQPTGDARSDVLTTLETTHAEIAAFREGAPCVGPGDADGDGVCDNIDDCLEVANPGQVDSDFDGYGNACDADYNDDGVVGLPDFARLANAFGTVQGHPDFDPAVDVNGDGVIGLPEYGFLGSAFGGTPGPSGLDCAGEPPCF
jgi:hypothetical protein